jgi:hypothetical protein
MRMAMNETASMVLIMCGIESLGHFRAVSGHARPYSEIRRTRVDFHLVAFSGRSESFLVNGDVTCSGPNSVHPPAGPLISTAPLATSCPADLRKTTLRDPSKSTPPICDMNFPEQSAFDIGHVDASPQRPITGDVVPGKAGAGLGDSAHVVPGKVEAGLGDSAHVGLAYCIAGVRNVDLLHSARRELLHTRPLCKSGPPNWRISPPTRSARSSSKHVSRDGRMFVCDRGRMACDVCAIETLQGWREGRYHLHADIAAVGSGITAGNRADSRAYSVGVYKAGHHRRRAVQEAMAEPLLLERDFSGPLQEIQDGGPLRDPRIGTVRSWIGATKICGRIRADSVLARGPRAGAVG